MAESLKKVRKAKSAGSLLSAILDLGKAMITCDSDPDGVHIPADTGIGSLLYRECSHLTQS